VSEGIRRAIISIMRARQYQRWCLSSSRHSAVGNGQVTGMVAQPRIHSLYSPSERLPSVLGRVGGLKRVGSERRLDHVVLFPTFSISAAAASACNSGEDHPITEYATICDTSQSIRKSNSREHEHDSAGWSLSVSYSVRNRSDQSLDRWMLRIPGAASVFSITI
jgi:hypothetical protein